MLLVDSRVLDKVFVNKKFIKFYKLFTILLRKSIRLRLVDNKLTLNINYVAQITIDLNKYVKIL